MKRPWPPEAALQLPPQVAAKLEALRATDPDQAAEIAERHRRIVANAGVIGEDAVNEALERLVNSIGEAG